MKKLKKYIEHPKNVIIGLALDETNNLKNFIYKFNNFNL